MKNRANIILTHNCNLRCMHCYMDAKPCREDFEKTYNKAIKLIDKLKKDEFDSIMFTGGECMIFPKLRELIIYAKNKGFSTSIFTNGMLYDENIFDLVDKINISLDGPKDIHNKIRGSKDSYDKILKCLDYFKKKDIYTTVQCTINNLNYDKFDFISNFAINYLNIRNIKFVFTTNEGRAKSNGLFANKEIIEYVNNMISDLYIKTKYHIQFCTNLFNKYEYENYLLEDDFIFPVWFDLVSDEYYVMNNQIIKTHDYNKYNINDINNDIIEIKKRLVNIDINEDEYVDIENLFVN